MSDWTMDMRLISRRLPFDVAKLEEPEYLQAMDDRGLLPHVPEEQGDSGLEQDTIGCLL